MAKKRIAHKVEIRVDDDNDTTFTKLANVKKIKDPKKSRAVVDVSCLDSDIDEGEPSPRMTLGDLVLDLFWDENDSDQGRLDTLIESAAIVPFQIHWPFSDTPVTKTFDGWIKELGDVENEGGVEIMRNVIIHVTSKPVTS